MSVTLADTYFSQRYYLSQGRASFSLPPFYVPRPGLYSEFVP